MSWGPSNKSLQRTPLRTTAEITRSASPSSRGLQKCVIKAKNAMPLRMITKENEPRHLGGNRHLRRLEHRADSDILNA